MRKLLIRAEDKNEWERRAPLVPEDVAKLIQETGTDILVENSDKRFFKEDEYKEAGARIYNGKTTGDVIVGIKEIPPEKLLPGKTYLFFSHTTKGQETGLPILRKLMRTGATLIDYEKITDADNRRLMHFGRYAGDAGVLDLLNLMGENWSKRGMKTPFQLCRRAREYPSVKAALADLSLIGKKIAQEGLCTELASPFVIGILGYGNVATGVQDIANCLPVQYVEPQDLKAFVKHANWNAHTIYISVFKENDIVRRKTDGLFDLGEYYKFPERYFSIFETYLPHFTLLINALYWDKQYPRFVTWEGLKRLHRLNGSFSLNGIADISCDINGAIECTVKSTNSGMPAYRCNPSTQSIADGHIGDGIVILAVDNLPAELPNDSSTHFSRQLTPYMPNILSMDHSKPLETSGLLPEIQKAVIVYRGELTPGYEYLNAYLQN